MYQRRRLHGRYCEWTIEEIVTDPWTRDLMWVDHMDPDAFQELLHSLASGSLPYRYRRLQTASTSHTWRLPAVPSGADADHLISGLDDAEPHRNT